jgi:hypothetical protein
VLQQLVSSVVFDTTSTSCKEWRGKQRERQPATMTQPLSSEP